ncbi:MAG TPA: 16S rRNA (guanine(527)-N(7))-methyltransferase RsmG [Sphingomicrobium sp.]|jgi:16S rRNA (guanine527-N7)-methyltransferase|nr:16S rRNA (guanine(527)-N(7))-methyltransferase RsmG [Sphingomicrobium sp.]
MMARLAEVTGLGSVPRETFERLKRYAALLRVEATRQNLVSAATLDSLWERHVIDSAQLVRFQPSPGASWADIGSGAGLPGIVVAILTDGPVLLIEPRRLRAEFLNRVIGELGLEPRVKVAVAKVERVSGQFDVITARAVASLGRLLEISTHLSTTNTLWVLPKGKAAQSELAEARRNWHCSARSVPSRTDPESEILLLHDVKPRGGR